MAEKYRNSGTTQESNTPLLAAGSFINKVVVEFQEPKTTAQPERPECSYVVVKNLTTMIILTPPDNVDVRGGAACM